MTSVAGAARAGSTADQPGLKVLIHYTALNRGGAEQSLLRLMAGLVLRGCEVHLVLTVPGGELEPDIDPAVVVHHLRRSALAPARRGAIASMARMLGWASGRWQERRSRALFRGMHFDAAFIGRAGMPHEFVFDTVNARKRFVFVRSDPAVDTGGRWADRIARYRKRTDYYICVSAFVQQAMAARFPEIAPKLTTIYNLIQPERMRARAAVAGDPFGPGLREGPCVLSVCRLQERQKALLRMVDVHRRLLAEGVPHTWHVLGDGPDRALLEQAIAAHGVASSFILHGAVSNPFPWYAHADLVAVLSRYEGLCGVVNEARVLERPVVATRFAGVAEQIENGVNGVIVEQDVDGIVAGMGRLLRDPGLRSRLASGGYPRELLDDDAKIDALTGLIGNGRASGDDSL